MIRSTTSAVTTRKSHRPYRQYPLPRPENFISILYNILEHHNYWCLHWNEDGTQIIVEHPESVAREVLPHHFGTRKYQSFTRQFHLYRFRRIADSRRDKKYKGYCRFFHPDFLRDHPHLISGITRVKVSKASAAARKEKREKAAKAKAEAKAPVRITKGAEIKIWRLNPASPNTSPSNDGTISPSALTMSGDDMSTPDIERTAPEFNTPEAKDAIGSLQILEDVVDELSLRGKSSRNHSLHSAPLFSAHSWPPAPSKTPSFICKINLSVRARLFHKELHRIPAKKRPCYLQRKFASSLPDDVS
ncbi:winged helix DNA-binding domain-containing protein [Linderina pennispora]|uniref:Winged helix DNA-binding domain-containing protein n=1 Tax=Linderina pennispora TaxID=61395 RepID=A0A1Y1VSB0_9FUNG|nr:winged helix DNA-binding domain-containing protein [Linderina pennispora]ORX63935.1 winged helix DNA-binding domain-containing protein [Linderina pennispora]